MKTYIVTGGSSGIGLQIVKVLLSQNANVAILDVKDCPKELDIHKDRIIFQKGSSADEKVVQDFVHKVASKWKDIDGLINNTGIMLRKPMVDLSLEEWNQVISTNLGSAFLLSRSCIPFLRTTHGSILNISSTRAHQSEPNTESYSATKGALLALTHSLAISLGPDIRVNCISPGWIDSRPDEEKLKAPLTESDHAQHPVGRVGTTEDIAQLALWLLSEKSSFITGQEFVSDGGMTRKMIYEE